MQQKFVLTDLLGLILGILLGYHIRNQVHIEMQCKINHIRLKEYPLFAYEEPPIAIDRPESGFKSGTIFIGLMSAHKFLDTRIDAAINTWMKYLPPSVKVEVFADNVGELNMQKKIRTSELSNGISVVQLPGVSDHFYPPQKKSFSMLKYMHDVYIDKYDWFIRLDDDAYIETRNILKLLSKINSTKPIFMGHVGYGLHDEDYLGFNESFCMGGTGMVFSQQLLRRLAPKLKTCLNTLFTQHEDVEVGRCVQKTTGSKCTTSWETAEIFYQDFKTETGYIKNLNLNSIDEVVVFHPNKSPSHQRKLHTFLLQRKINHFVTKIARLEREIRNINKSNSHWDADEDGVFNNRPSDMHIDHAVYSAGRILKAGIHPSVKKMFQHYDDTFRMSIIRSGKSVRSVSRHFTYHNVNPLFAVESLSKTTLTYVYGAQKVHELNLRYRQYFPKHVQFFNEPIDLDIDELRSRKELLQKSQKLNNTSDQNSLSAVDSQKIGKVVVNFFMILSGRKDYFLRFLSNFEEVFLKKEEKVNLIVVYFPKTSTKIAENEAYTESKIIEESVNNLQQAHSDRMIKILDMGETPYCKTIGLQKAKDEVKNENEIIFFCDVDMIFKSSAFLNHVRRNTIQGKRVFYPVTFSQFNPNVVYENAGKPPSHFEYKETDGFWRYYGFGMLSIFKSDFSRTKGFDTNICGWGQEDVEMAGSVMTANLDVFQSCSPYQVHLYHNKTCADSLPKNRLVACKAVRLLHYGSQTMLNKVYEKKLGRSL